jgi:ribosomal protein L37AE/L43A
MKNQCKFCGAKPVKKIAPTGQLMWLQCKNCKSKNMTTMEYNMESATARWNEKNPSKGEK